MLGLFYVISLPILAYSINTDVTFKNVEFRGYSVYTLKFTKKIVESNDLKENLPRELYDHLEFKDQNIPILRKDSIKNIENLDELTITYCKVTVIEAGAFKSLPMLRKLSLQGNDLEEIISGVFNGLALSALDLSKNRIKNIEATALDNLPQILNIHLADNQIKTWNKKWFFNTPLLSRISFQNNSLEELPAEAFTNLNGEKKYGFLKLTINLIFSENKIKHIDENAFKGLKNINNLWLDNNNLTEFSEKLLENVEIQNLRINSNKISCLEGDLSKILKAEMTNLDSNPYDCKCFTKIKEWVKKHEKNVDTVYLEMLCITERLREKMTALEKRLKEIKEEEEEQNPDILVKKR